MDLRSQSWEYASEMVLKSVHMQLRTEEVPIRFLKDREGRLSHHKRSGWFSPWQAAWINLRAMFVYGANFFLFKPGLVLLALGLLLTLPLVVRRSHASGRSRSRCTGCCSGCRWRSLGLQCVYMGMLSQVFFDYAGAVTARWFRRFPYNRIDRRCRRRCSRPALRAGRPLDRRTTSATGSGCWPDRPSTTWA